MAHPGQDKSLGDVSANMARREAPLCAGHSGAAQNEVARDQWG